MTMTISTRHTGPTASTAARSTHGTITAFPGGRSSLVRRIVILDPQAMSRRGMALLLGERRAVAVTEAATLDQVLRLFTGGNGADIVLVEGTILHSEGALPRLVAVCRPAAVIVLGPSGDPAFVRRCLAEGARAYIGQGESRQALDAVMTFMLEGAEAARGYVQLPRWALNDAEQQAPAVETATVDADGMLTPRQRDIFHLIEQGCSNKEIARRLGVLEGTVKVHVRAVMQRLGLHNRTQVALLAARSPTQGA